MTQPSLNQTFDTSLIDLREYVDSRMDLRLSGSFSTTDTDPSDYEIRAMETVSAMEMRKDGLSSADVTPKPSQMCKFTDAERWEEKISPVASSAAQLAPDTQGKPKRTTRYVSTKDAYDEWAAVYDSDGNILQAIDDLELESMLPELLHLALNTAADEITVFDIGCGTGRNTAKLIGYQWPLSVKIDITGFEMSRGMLDVARNKLIPIATPLQNVSLQLVEANAFGLNSTIPDLPSANCLISTLVLEHIPLIPFFRSLNRLLQPGGYALVTNMHQEMGLQSQAGFVSADGTKVRGESWAHGVEDTVAVAEDEGFELIGRVKERGIDEAMVGSEVGQRGKKWIGIKVWYGMILRKTA